MYNAVRKTHINMEELKPVDMATAFFCGFTFLLIALVIVAILAIIIIGLFKMIWNSVSSVVGFVFEPPIVPAIKELQKRVFVFILSTLFKTIWNVLKALWRYICFLFCDGERFEPRQTCDTCKITDGRNVRYCHECKLNVCSLCYNIHQRFGSCRDHKTSSCKETNKEQTEIPLTRKHLEVDSVRDVEIEDNGTEYATFLSVSLIKLKNKIALCIYHKTGTVFCEHIEGGKPNYMLRNISRYCDQASAITYFPKSGLVFFSTKEYVRRFKCIKTAYIPFYEKMKHFLKISPYQFSEIRFQLKVFENSSCLKEIDGALKGQAGETYLYTEFDDGIAVLVYKKENVRFKLVPKWYVMHFSHEGKINDKFYIKGAPDGEVFVQSPKCMAVTLHNTLVVCGSTEFTEVNMEGIVVSKVDIKENIYGHITAVTSDDEGNIYVSGSYGVVQLSDSSHTIREIVSTENAGHFKENIVDICFSAKTQKLYVVTKNGNTDHYAPSRFNLLCFKFI